MAQQGSGKKNEMGENGNDSGVNTPPGVVGGAALVGATAGGIVGGPFGAILGASAAAGACLRKDQVTDDLEMDDCCLYVVTVLAVLNAARSDLECTCFV